MIKKEKVQIDETEGSNKEIEVTEADERNKT